MQKKYHITAKGTVEPCDATERACKYAIEEEHIIAESLEEAYKLFDDKNEKENQNIDFDFQKQQLIKKIERDGNISEKDLDKLLPQYFTLAEEDPLQAQRHIALTIFGYTANQNQMRLVNYEKRIVNGKNFYEATYFDENTKKYKKNEVVFRDDTSIKVYLPGDSAFKPFINMVKYRKPEYKGLFNDTMLQDYFSDN